MNRSTPGLPFHHQLLESTQTPLCWECYPVISSCVIPFFSCPQSFPASVSFQVSQLFALGGQNISASTSVLQRSFSFSISPSSDHSGLISFRIDWLDLLAIRGTLKSLCQHKSKASILWCPTLTSICDYGKTIALTTWSFVSTVMSAV